MVRQAVLQAPGQEDRHAFRLPMWQTAAVEHIETVRTTVRFSPTAGETAGIAGLAAHSTTDPSLICRNSRDPLESGSAG
jgi:hypothetical protein